jgi:hypothetical protein
LQLKNFTLIIAEDLYKTIPYPKNQRNMLRRRTAVYVAPSETVGHDLVFRHYTNKVVVGKYPETKMAGTAETKRQKSEKKPGR